MGARARPTSWALAALIAATLVPLADASSDGREAEAASLDPTSHCDVTGTVLVPQATKATTVTDLGVGAANGVLNYRITCVHPDASFRLTYNGRPMAATCAGFTTLTVDGRVGIADFDIVFWPSGTLVRPIREFRTCGDESGKVPFAAAFADVVLIGGLPGASFTYWET